MDGLVVIGFFIVVWVLLSRAERSRRREAARQAVARQKAIEDNQVLDEDAVTALVGLGFSSKAAKAALRASGWKGDTTEERVVNALSGNPEYIGTKTRVTG